MPRFGSNLEIVFARMLYTLIHLLLLLTGTCGLWLVRRNWLFLFLGLMLFPLPATFFNFCAVPVAQSSAEIASADCTGSTLVLNGVDTVAEEKSEAGIQGSCASTSRSLKLQTLALVFAVNSSTVVIGFLTGLLCLGSLRHHRRSP